MLLWQSLGCMHHTNTLEVIDALFDFFHKDDRGSAQTFGYITVLIVLPDAVVAITWMYASYKYLRSNWYMYWFFQGFSSSTDYLAVTLIIVSNILGILIIITRCYCSHYLDICGLQIHKKLMSHVFIFHKDDRGSVQTFGYLNVLIVLPDAVVAISMMYA